MTSIKESGGMQQVVGKEQGLKQEGTFNASGKYDAS
jgi:hypothetical protein